MKLSTRLFIFSSLLLVLLPISAYFFIGKVEKTILQGQEEAQSMTAAAIATVVQGYTDLFTADEDALYVYPVKRSLSVDGYASDDEDWTALKDKFSHYKKRDGNSNGDGEFSLLLIDSAQYLYAYLKVDDSNIVYRNPRYVPLDSSDHLRLEYLDSDGQRQRLVMLAEGQGHASVYKVNEDWKTWVSGHHVNAVYAVWRETADGYDIEFRLPKQWLEPQRRLSISMVNVFGENERNPDTIVSTQVLNSDLLNPALVRSSAISRAIKNLGDSGSQICVIDKYRRVRAVIGGQNISDSLCQATDKVNRYLVTDVLDGHTRLIHDDRNDNSSDHNSLTGSGLIVAAHPVFLDDEIIGAVLVSSSRQQILSTQRETLLSIMLASLALFLLIIIGLLLFSSRLAFRINRLKKQTSSLIDDSGRFIDHVDLSDCKDGDEIGDLSRSFSLLLARLNSYTSFLETVPRMLRHEILNPVNTISMSLQNLQKNKCQDDVAQTPSSHTPGLHTPGLHTPSAQTGDSREQERNINVASDAIKQLQLIVSSLTEAANIDEVLAQDEMETVDIAALISEYVSNSQLKHAHAKLRYYGKDSGVYVLANDVRIVQLIDKIKDNALDFSLPETEISFELDVNQRDQVVICVKNEGETIPQERLDVLFNGMVSHRTEKTAVPHLGIGLYVAFQIANFHQGQLTIANRRDKRGVEVRLVLPRRYST